ncbi:MAG: ArnT family glycosyltransferase [Sandaracinaceae bacterium]
MEWTPRQGRIFAGIAGALVAALTLPQLSGFGIWDPWELSAADLARQLAVGEAGALERPPLSLWLVADGFSLFGIHEWAGRLPMALTGLMAVLFAYVVVSRFAGRRAGAWAALVTGTSPLFLLNARQMLGAAPAFAASAAVFMCALSAVFQPTRLGSAPVRRQKARIGWLVGLAVAIALSVLASGALLGVLPPLLAVAAVVVARGELRGPRADRGRFYAAVAVMVVAAVALIGTAQAIWPPYAGFGWWPGRAARGGAPPPWEVGIELVFHSFAPWSGLLPLALAHMLLGGPRAPSMEGGDRRLAPPKPVHVGHAEEDALRLGVVVWVAFAFLAQTLFAARFGPATFLGVVGAAAAVALLLRDAERSGRGWWGTAVVGFLFVALIVRDYRGYPSAPIAGLAVDGIEVPDGFYNPELLAGTARSLSPKYVWMAVLGLFGMLAALGFAADPSSERRGLRAIGDDLKNGAAKAKLLAVLRLGLPYDLLTAQWKRGVGFKVWLVLLGLLVATLLGLGLTCWFAGDALAESGVTTLAVRVGRVLALVPPGVVLGIAAVRLTWAAFSALGENRFLPLAIAALIVGGHTAHKFLPELSSHFSPREVYDTYNELADGEEPLGEFRVGGRAAAYYTSGDRVVELDSQGELVTFLQNEDRVWAAFRADDLAAINREYRRAAGRHLFIADARSARMILATNQAVAHRDNQNYLAEAVLDEAPTPQHRTEINFDNRIELFGYDLTLPQGSSVGPGQSFTITWYFRVLAPVPGGYQPFVHIDGPGQRINGDHEPVNGRYPLRLWETDDIIADTQEIQVPANYRRGDLTLYLGFYSGENRLEVVSGPADDVNRARAGTLRVR